MNRILCFSVFLFAVAVTGHAAAPAIGYPSGIGGGGALFAPSFSPNTPNELYVACDVAGLFRSTDLGATCVLQGSREIVGNHGSIVQYTNSSQTMYALVVCRRQSRRSDPAVCAHTRHR